MSLAKHEDEPKPKNPISLGEIWNSNDRYPGCTCDLQALETHSRREDDPVPLPETHF